MQGDVPRKIYTRSKSSMKKNASLPVMEPTSTTEKASALDPISHPRRKTSSLRKINGQVDDHGGSKSRRAIRPTVSGLHSEPSADMDSRQILRALMALKKGDFTVRLPIDWSGTAGKIADTFNEVA